MCFSSVKVFPLVYTMQRSKRVALLLCQVLWRTLAQNLWTLWPASNRVAIDCQVRKACLRSRLSFCPNCIRVRTGLQLAPPPSLLCKAPETSAREG